ncbi:cytochrome P450 [Aspergillus clavatus NRRL 1]|uniref:Cytochrome P450 oxidoreductase, putative n=1 Tax=Aspergillus clavatus (strain ATCC 1007 / CBS 513.65 / DSM 816 / NCTC 3887 / NRRL 1 / QM 1276 / 107) TaxID=344612 RepID=A1CAY9_ASPCL|nr:Cytochrome P450 oxidoreductase, putative [Aspergillus clavatus NRRL 1]EAW12907.1 Cytochrome P450 oxidoreductase, putative [Aspergillus clavatus NRRL 1]
MESLILLVLIILPASVLIYKRLTPRNLPPSPPGDFFLGHLRRIPSSHAEYQYAKWSRTYNSDILSLRMLTRCVIVVNSVDAAHALLKKPTAADRPRFALYEIMGWGITLTFLRSSSPRFKLHRRLLQRSFSPSMCKDYRPIQMQEIRAAVAQIRSHPETWEVSLRRFAIAVVMRIGFGMDSAQAGGFVDLATAVEEATGRGGVPGFSVVDAVPALRWIPVCVAKRVGMLWGLVHAQQMRGAVEEFHNGPWGMMEEKLRAGTGETGSSFLGMHLREGKVGVEDLKGAAGTIAIAGGNTTFATIVVCILNLMLQPGVQARARAELDGVLGVDARGLPLRLPTFEDRERLPFLERVIQETTRWAPLSPLGIPHAMSAEESVGGLTIPRGAVVYANAWAMTHDERVYAEPERFDPDRYLRGEPLPEGPFGFGRRVCPGQHLALTGVYIAMATLLATVSWRCPVDEAGREKRPEVQFSDGLSGVPDRFECEMQARDAESKEVL